MSNPHDALFKAVFGQPEHARGALQAVLPPAVGAAIDWPTLMQCPGSFVEPAMRGRHADLLFSATWRTGGEALIYLLFEHQSSPEPRMAYRLLLYMTRIWERWWTEHDDKPALPVVVPIVLYHGESAWSTARSFDELLAMPEAVRAALAPQLVRFTYLLDDLSTVPDSALRARAMTALGKLVDACFKHARGPGDLFVKLAEWAETMHDVFYAPNGLEALATVMSYILEVNGRIEHHVLEAFVERMVGPEAKDSVMTAGERLIQQGERKMVLLMLRRRFAGKVNAEIEQRVATASSERLELWAERLVAPDATLAEILAD